MFPKQKSLSGAVLKTAFEYRPLFYQIEKFPPEVGAAYLTHRQP